MAKRALLLLALMLAAASPALAGDGYGDQKRAVDAKLSAVQARIAQARARESQLSTRIGGLTTQIQTLEQRVGDVSSRLSALQADLALHQRRLAALDALFAIQTTRFHELRREYGLAVERLDLRLVDIYKQDEPTTVDVLLAARSFDDVLSQLDYLGAIATQDKRVAAAVASSKHQVKVARARTREIRNGVRQEARVIGARVQQQAILRGELVANRSRLASARSSSNQALVVTRKQEQSEIQESQALQSASAELAAKIREADAQARAATSGASSPTPAGPSSAGFIWPVSGPITSPFGERWGTLHPGIDIGVPTGTPIHAAAAGTVIWCGWMSGYGNLVMIDHHNGLATLYGHQSRIAVGCNEEVSQGQVIGYSGCTGFCTGPHLHFEVRLNGNPVDPLGYLP